MSGWARTNTLEQPRPPLAYRSKDTPQPQRDTAPRQRRPAGQPSSCAPVAPRPALPGLILVVDDDAAIRAAISEILEMEGYQVITAADGAAALRQIEQTPPALMLLDMRMPGLNGWDVASALQQRGTVVPTLVMTAAQDARQWAEQIGRKGILPSRSISMSSSPQSSDYCRADNTSQQHRASGQPMARTVVAGSPTVRADEATHCRDSQYRIDSLPPSSSTRSTHDAPILARRARIE